jgi:hypothetical protein
MMRSISKCGAVALCVAVTACSSLPPPKEESTGAAVPEPESEVAELGVTEDQPDIAAMAQDPTGAPVRRGGRRENLTCYTGTDNRHARIGVQLVDDQVAYFAYYSKSRPRTCSLEAGRRDPYSRWTDSDGYSTVTLADRKGRLRIERDGGSYRFAFFDVDRVRYCGMQGKINGSLTVTRGKSSCEVQGIMDGHAM